MLDVCLQLIPECDIFIACAAVADYRPADVQSHKIKKNAEEMSLQLVRNPDIVSAVAAVDEPPFTVGFAAETRNLLTYARDKMQRKKLDMIIANDVSQPGIGFNSDENEVTLVSAATEQALPRASKNTLARQIIEAIAAATEVRSG
jgi:phosphopantothenoylcysteine decarboxylase/phosphopantothenate--cysteine ligase